MRKNGIPEILYEDDALLVCVKPSGCPVETARIAQSDLVSLLKNYLVKKGEKPYIGVVHRLDQPVEGVMVFAKTRAAAADLSAQVRDRRIRKEYMAVVCPEDDPEKFFPGQAGENGTEDGWIDLEDYLRREPGSNISRVVPKETPGAKKAQLSYRVMKRDQNTGRMLVQIRLGTGRHHQIRVQFAHAGMPLYADARYGKALPRDDHQSVALCSCGLGFRHPATKKWMKFELDGTQRLSGALEKM